MSKEAFVRCVVSGSRLTTIFRAFARLALPMHLATIVAIALAVAGSPVPTHADTYTWIGGYGDDSGYDWYGASWYMNTSPVSYYNSTLSNPPAQPSKAPYWIFSGSNWIDAATGSMGAAPGAGDVANVNGGVAQVISPVDVGTLNLEAGASLSIYNSTLTVIDGVTDDGTIQLSIGNNGASLVFSGSQTLSGAGSVTMYGNWAGELCAVGTSNGGMLTQAAGHTISGWGTINAALDQSGPSQCQLNGETLYLATNAMTNAATMEATDGGTLNISRITVNNAGGTILASGGNVQIWRHGRRRHAYQHGHVIFY